MLGIWYRMRLFRHSREIFNFQCGSLHLVQFRKLLHFIYYATSGNNSVRRMLKLNPQVISLTIDTLYCLSYPEHNSVMMISTFCSPLMLRYQLSYMLEDKMRLKTLNRLFFHMKAYMHLVWNLYSFQHCSHCCVVAFFSLSPTRTNEFLIDNFRSSIKSDEDWSESGQVITANRNA